MGKANSGRSGRCYRIKNKTFETIKDIAEFYDVPVGEITAEMKKDGGEMHGGPKSPDGYAIRVVYMVDQSNYQKD